MKTSLIAVMLVSVAWFGGSDTHAEELKPHARIKSDEQLLSLAFSPDGKLLATGDANLTIKLWDVATGKEKTTLIKAKSPRNGKITEGFSKLAFSPDGKFLAAASDKARLRIWDVATGELRVSVRPHNSGIFGVAFSPDGKLLATGGAINVRKWIQGVDALVSAGQVNLWDVPTFKVKRTFEPGDSRIVLCLAFSPDSKLLAAGTQSGDVNNSVVALWDVPTGKERKALKGKGQYEIVNSVAISPDGKLLAAGSGAVTGTGTLRLWNLENSMERAVLHGHTDQVLSVAFSPDSKWLASSGFIESLRLWDVVTGKEYAVSNLNSGGFSVEFSPNGKLLAVTEHDVVSLWDVPTRKRSPK